MAAELFVPPSKALDANANPYAGAKWFFYLTGTTTPTPVYTTAARTVAHTNPVVADSSGKFANIYYNPAITYRAVLKNLDETVTLHDIDPINPSGSVGINVKDYGAVGDGVTNDTAAVQAAINTNKSVYFPAGIYLVDSLNVPASARGAVYQGDGFYHYDDQYQTVIKARTALQASIFTIASGADCVTFNRMRLDGDQKADKVIDGSFGAFLTVDHCGIYDGINYGIYSKQGLARIDKCFMAGSKINCHLWSDSSISNSEFTQEPALTTEICLLLAAGGNRITNVWANSGTVACVKLAPFDGTTNHINTDIVSLYAGETFGGGVSRPVIHIEGTVSNRVQQVRIANAFIVCAQANVDHINDGIYANYVTDLELCNLDFRGQGAGATATLRMNYGVNATNTENLNIIGGTFRDVNKNCIKIGTGCSNIGVVGTTFINWAPDSGAAGDDFAAILSTVGIINCTGCTFTIATGASGPFAAKVANAVDLLFIGAVINYPSATIVTATSGTPAWIYKRAGVPFDYTQNLKFVKCDVDDVLGFQPLAPASATNNSVFLNSATSLPSWKNGSGVVRALYTEPGAAITAPTGGATIDAESRTAIDSIRSALTAAGITL